MWLLDTNSLRLVSFANEDETPFYAILSHTWSDDEVSFQDIISFHTGTRFVEKTGWSKIHNACRVALSLRIHYIWIDTCCIDKSSSAELQEAINSMFRWYELSQMCLAYLSDVSASEDPEIEGSSFRCSRWFKRGWTLQELIAPCEVSFYDKDWKLISKRDRMAGLIGDVTGIKRFFRFDQDRIDDIYDDVLSTISVAERMSWMNERETTKPEDLTYCLLGIFDINMPMLYGEGHKAFQRLQEEIMKKSDDSTLLSWDYEDQYSRWDFQDDSLLAPSPSCFRGCMNLESCHLEGFSATSFSMNQRGLQMEVPVRVDPTHQLLVYMILGCYPRLEKGFPFGPRKKYSSEETESSLGNRSHKSFVAVPLISTSACNIIQPGQGVQKGEYWRPRWCRPILVSEDFLSQAQSTSIIIRRPSAQFFKFKQFPISIRIPQVPILEGFTVLGIYPPQPIGGSLIFVPLLAGSSQNSPDTAGHVSPPRRGLQNKFPIKVYCKEHQVMISTRVQDIGNFIVVLGYLVEECQDQPFVTLECKDIKCRVFKTSENCDLEGLQRLSMTQNFTQLSEVRSIFQTDRYMFNIGIGVDEYLVIQVTEDEGWDHIIDLSVIGATYSLGN